MPFKSDTVGNASKNESSFSKNKIHVKKILLAVPEAIPKRPANITMLGFRLIVVLELVSAVPRC